MTLSNHLEKSQYSNGYDDNEESTMSISEISQEETMSDDNIETKQTTSKLKQIFVKYKRLFFNIGALVLGILIGIFMMLVFPDTVNSWFMENIFTPVNTMFLNALKMVVAPLIMFSIASSIAKYNNITTLGRIFIKVLGGYFLSSFTAIAIGFMVYHMNPIGDPSLRETVTDAASSTIAKGQGVSTSIKDTIVGIVPSDIVSPFLKANMMQIIFMAILIGVAAASISEKLSYFGDMMNECFQVFTKVTTLIIDVMPLAIFSSMTNMVLTTNRKSLLSVITWVPMVYLGDLIVMLFYAIIIFIFARVNPLIFFKKFSPAMVTAYTFASSIASLPTSMEVCDKSLGISEKIYPFSLPLGATMNMNGSCVTQMITALFMSKIFEVSITPAVIFKLALFIFVLATGSGVPGGNLVCISLLLPQINIPSEAISIIMGVYPIVDMMQACTNVTGDAVITLIVAKSEKILNLEVFKS